MSFRYFTLILITRSSDSYITPCSQFEKQRANYCTLAIYQISGILCVHIDLYISIQIELIELKNHFIAIFTSIIVPSSMLGLKYIPYRIWNFFDRIYGLILRIENTQ